jgi:hypothetical protein
MTSDQFVAFVERKLTDNGAHKVVPDASAMVEAYAAFRREQIAHPVFERYLARLAQRAVAVPADLEARVHAYLGEHPEEAWDNAVRSIAAKEITQ